jgi:hypothetical protein
MHGTSPRSVATSRSAAGILGASLCAASLVLLYLAEARGFRVVGKSYAIDDAMYFIPHLVCFALLAAGMNLAGGIAALVTSMAYGLSGTVFGLGVILSGARGYGLAELVIVQIVLFGTSIAAIRARPSFPEIFPAQRQAIALVLAIGAWLSLGPALHALDAPRLQAQAAESARKLFEARDKVAERQFLTIAQCLQRYAPAESASYYPETLAELVRMPGCARAGDPPPAGFTLDYQPFPPNDDGRRSGFRLVAGSAGVESSPRMLVTDQNEWVLSRSGMGVDQLTDAWTSPLEWMFVAAQCIERARDADSTHRYPETLGTGARVGGCSLRYTGDDSTTAIQGGERGEYLMTYAAPAHPNVRPGGFTLSVSPRRDSSGLGVGAALRSYLIDSSGAVRISLRPRAATVADSMLPSCPERRLVIQECNPYVRRQRWGLAMQIPRVFWSARETGNVGVGDTLHFAPQFDGVAAQDSVVEYRFAWHVTDADSVVPVRSRRSVAQPFGNDVIFRLQHVYRVPGTMALRFSVLTAGGERYEYRDSVRVLPHAAGSR